MATKPLEGISVLDFSQYLPGPLCGQHLADLGADVLKIENPKGGDLARPTPTAVPSPSRAGTTARIYLICDQPDRDAVAPIADLLFARGYDVTLPLFEGNETEVREDHEENLRLCDAVLIYHGAGTEFWLRSKLRDLARIAGLGRTAPFRAVGIYATATPQMASFRTHDALVMQESGPVTAATLDPFVALLEHTAHGDGKN